jgi:hypothetical protein
VQQILIGRVGESNANDLFVIIELKGMGAVQHQELLWILRNPTSHAEEPLRNPIRHASTSPKIEIRLEHCCGRIIGHSKSADMFIQKD